MLQIAFHTAGCQRCRMIWQSLDRQVQLARQNLPTHRTRPLRRSGHLRDSILSICVFARRTFLLEGEACSSCGMSVHSVAGDSNRMWRVHAQDTVDALTASTTRRVHTGETEFPAPTPESLLPRRTAPWVRRCQRLVHAHQADHCDLAQQS